MELKNRWGKYLLTAAAVICLTIGNSAVSYADEAIKSIYVIVTASAESESISAEAENSRYSVVSCEFTNSQGGWQAGETPSALLELVAEDGCYFNSISSSSATIKGASYVSSSRSTDRKTLNVKIKLKPVSGTLSNIEEAYWDEKPLGKAKWSKTDPAASYELKLYRNGDLIDHVSRINSTSYDFFSKMTVKGDYRFSVRSVAKSDSDSKYLDPGQWTESDYQEITSNDAKNAKDRGTGGDSSGISRVDGSGPSAGAAGWIQDSKGWWYKNADGTNPTNNWMMIGGKWYLFGMDGYMLTGWQRYNGKEYYLTSNGDMVSGWFQDDRIWYYLDPDNGKLSGGWFPQGNSWYYLNPDGSMATGWIQSKGNWYYMDTASGQMVTDEVVGERYINSEGVWLP